MRHILTLFNHGYSGDTDITLLVKLLCITEINFD